MKEFMGHRISYKMLPENPVIIDGGARYGEFESFLKEDIEEFRLHCFEPDPQNFILLKQNINNTNSFFHQKAITGKGGARELVRFEGFPGWSNVEGMYVSSAENRGKTAEMVGVDSVSINEIFSFVGENRIDFLKLDVEGAEYEIFDSMTQDTASRIDQFSVEYHSGLGKIPENAKKLGFEIIIIDEDTEIYGKSEDGDE